MGDNKRKQIRKLVVYKNIIAGMVNIPIIADDNCLSFKNDVEYEYARLI